jgi:transcriptional regulator with XRE-family HTH domain
MSAAINLLDKYAKTCYARSDAEIGRNLGLTRATVNGWRKGASHPDAESVEKMAKAINEPVGPWLAQIEAERARTPAGRQVWLRLAATLGTTLALALIITLPAHVASAAGSTAASIAAQGRHLHQWLVRAIARINASRGLRLRPCTVFAAA